MIRKFFSFFGAEVKGLHEAAYLLAFFGLAADVLGIIRDRLLASYFGAGPVLDTYYAAFRVSDLIFVTVSSVVAVSVLIPFLIEKLDKGHDVGAKFINDIFTIFFLTIIIVSVVVYFFMPEIIMRTLPGLAKGLEGEHLIVMSRIMLLSPILLGISNLFGSITQVGKKFALYAVSPLLYNIGIIVGVVVFYPMWGIYGLVWGVVFGAVMHAGIQIPSLVRSGFMPRFSFYIDFSSLRQTLTLSVPRTIALGANQLSTFFLISLASLMATGSIAIFNFAWNLQSVPQGIIGVSYSLAAFPSLAGFITRGERDKFIAHLGEACRHIVFWSMPVTVLFIVLRAQVVRVILGAGQFSWSDTRLTAAALAIFSVSVAAQSLLLLIVRGYYAASDTRTPLVVNVFCSVLIVVLAYVLDKTYYSFDMMRWFFESLLKVDGLQGTGVLMLPLAYSIGTILNLVLHLISFEWHFGKLTKTFSRAFWQSLSASIIMGFVAYLSLNVYGNVINLTTTWGIFLQGFAAGITGILAGIVVLYGIKNEEIEQVRKTLHSKIWKAKVVVPEQAQL